MSSQLYWGSIAFFTVVFGVLYAVAWSILLGVYENYLRYYQKADLQWTGRASQFPKPRIRLSLLAGAALLSAWLVVHFIIQPA